MFRSASILLIAIVLILGPAAGRADIWYRDADLDGWGDDSDWIDSPTQPAGYVAQPGDCDDTRNDIHPGAVEIPGDGVDQNCDGMEACYEDLDYDGYGSYVVILSMDFDCYDPGEAYTPGDCDDTMPSVHPGAAEVPGNGIDDDCDGYEACYEDADMDGYGSDAGTTIPSVDLDCVDLGESSSYDDCDDSAADVHPGAIETWYDGIDQDCDGWSDFDADFDGYDSVDYGGDDCDDGDPGIGPGTAEIWYDGIDQDCDGANDFDADHDGYVKEGFGAFAGGTAPGVGDCDDNNAAVHPGAAEVCGDLLDNDCNGQTDETCVTMAILAIADVGNDQGRQVRLQWSRSQDDQAGGTVTITAYDVYRRIDANKAGSDKAWPPGDWDFLTQVPASGQDVYHAVVPTLCDSTGAGICWSVFFLRARTPSPLVFEDCAPDSGYSIDNLAPAVPTGLALGGGILTWDDPMDADFDFFSVYGSTAPELTGEAVLLGHTTGTTMDVSGAGYDYLLVAATDFAGNRGEAAAIASGLSGTPGPQAMRTRLLGNHPNPFNPSTVISFELAEPGNATLTVFDLSGKIVIRLLGGASCPAGRTDVQWFGRDDSGQAVASGTYFYRLETGSYSETRRMVLIK